MYFIKDFLITYHTFTFIVPKIHCLLYWFSIKLTKMEVRSSDILSLNRYLCVNVCLVVAGSKVIKVTKFWSNPTSQETVLQE